MKTQKFTIRIPTGTDYLKTKKSISQAAHLFSLTRSLFGLAKVDIYTITPSLTLAGFASLTVCHVVQDILHGSAMREVALSHLTVGLLSPLTLVSM